MNTTNKKQNFHMQKIFTFFLLITCLPLFVIAQDSEIKYENYVYDENIRTVKFHVNGDPLGMPILPLKTNAQFLLSFDDMGDEDKNYTYSILHCDSNWQPSDLTELEFIDGYMDEAIDEYEFSFKTLREYTHYELLFPNDNITWTISGNYILLVHEDEDDEKRLIFTRRFMVVDYGKQVNIENQLVAAAKVNNLRTHHEFDFVVNHENELLRNPERTIKAVVLQNQRWDNAIFDIIPTYTRDNMIVFDYQGQIVFPAGKEFRFFDTRTLRTISLEVEEVYAYPDRYEVILEKDYKRGNLAYLHNEDANGSFVVDNFDMHNGQLSADYPDVFFTLNSPTVYQNSDVYIVGAFNDWRLTNKMTYNELISSYVASIPLKQGYHNYAYAVVSPPKDKTEKPVLNLTEIEGDWYETKNEYTFLIYYRPPGGNYDQLIADLVFETN